MIMSYATGSAPVELSNIRNMRSYLTTDTNILRDKITSTYERDYNEVYFNIFKGSTLTYSEDQ